MKQNIFLSKNDEKFNIAAIASDTECVIYILIDDFADYYISNLWTTSKTDNVKAFVGLDQTHLFFEYK